MYTATNVNASDCGQSLNPGWHIGNGSLYKWCGTQGVQHQFNYRRRSVRIANSVSVKPCLWIFVWCANTRVTREVCASWCFAQHSKSGLCAANGFGRGARRWWGPPIGILVSASCAVDRCHCEFGCGAFLAAGQTYRENRKFDSWTVDVTHSGQCTLSYEQNSPWYGFLLAKIVEIQIIFVNKYLS